MASYGQFCPVAKASEVFAERWTPLIVRELLMGSHRFSELQRGLPGIPRSSLVSRLRALQRAGLVERRRGSHGRPAEYFLTPPGEELLSVIEALGEWGQRWLNRDVERRDLDLTLLMWDMHRRVRNELLPHQRVVAQFDFYGARRGRYWLVLDRGEPSVCYVDPGFEVDLFVRADALAMHRVWIGRLSFGEALRQGWIEVDGPRPLVRAFPDWLALSSFAGIPYAGPVRRRNSVAAHS